VTLNQATIERFGPPCFAGVGTGLIHACEGAMKSSSPAKRRPADMLDIFALKCITSPGVMCFDAGRCCGPATSLAVEVPGRTRSRRNINRAPQYKILRAGR
jgi:hypothetical protein